MPWTVPSKYVLTKLFSLIKRCRYHIIICHYILWFRNIDLGKTTFCLSFGFLAFVCLLDFWFIAFYFVILYNTNLLFFFFRNFLPTCKNTFYPTQQNIFLSVSFLFIYNTFHGWHIGKQVDWKKHFNEKGMEIFLPGENKITFRSFLTCSENFYE